MTQSHDNYHAARWNEPIIMELGSEGERGVLVDKTDKAILEEIQNPLDSIPQGMIRSSELKLPQISQAQILRHYTRLSQMTLGFDVTPDASSGTCTMKYSPKVNEAICRSASVLDVHPLQNPSSIQGILKILFDFGEIMCEISGMNKYSFQASSGAQGIYTNACLIRAYHESNGEGGQRDEIITTAFSHPADAATPSVAGFKVITLMPGENGYPDFQSLQSVLSERTAGLMVTNPEDTGLFNPHIPAMVKAVQNAGGLCAYDQANANGLFGVVRAGDTGFDLCQFNLHKTFSAPHSAQGQGAAAVGVSEKLANFLPAPVVDFNGTEYVLDYDRPESIGKIRSFLGNVQTVIKAYAWVMSLGADGLKSVSETAVLNNNYLASKLAQIKGLDLPWDSNLKRIEQVRYSWSQLCLDTGLSTTDLARKMSDYGLQTYMESHVPRLVDEPMTLEPTESLSLNDLDAYVSVLKEISEQAYSDPESLKGAPYKSASDQLPQNQFNDPETWAMTWKAYKTKRK